uniref:Uncharacterized protein n=1 Tax=Mesocestoides corti TaxID=53468 RepID=A0A5K3F9D9_MESCO
MSNPPLFGPSTSSTKPPRDQNTYDSAPPQTRIKQDLVWRGSYGLSRKPSPFSLKNERTNKSWRGLKDQKLERYSLGGAESPPVVDAVLVCQLKRSATSLNFDVVRKRWVGSGNRLVL